MQVAHVLLLLALTPFTTSEYSLRRYNEAHQAKNFTYGDRGQYCAAREIGNVFNRDCIPGDTCCFLKFGQICDRLTDDTNGLHRCRFFKKDNPRATWSIEQYRASRNL
ncbi:hypothetical protein HDE_04104 [Halotydeus destructor]|nr:hypothetical protein HDE_04104 [Halotydeus destructor]